MIRTRIIYHVVLCTYRRQPLITPAVREVIYPALHQRVIDEGASGFYANGLADHVHIMIWMKTPGGIDKIIDRAKDHTQTIAKRLSPGFLWQAGYSIDSVNPYDHQRLVRYIRDQRQRHARARTWPDHEGICYGEKP